MSDRSVLYSPAWFVPYDDFRRRPMATGLAVDLDRWDGARWVSTGRPAVRTPSGAIAYPGLGRRREPAAAEPDLYRTRFAATGYRPLYPPDDPDAFDATQVGKEFLAYPYGDTLPPQIPARPEAVSLLPDTAYPYPPGTRVVRGLVRWAGSGAPVDNALVASTGVTPEGTGWRERTLTDAIGAFRLPLRWAGDRSGPQGEQFRLTAIQRPGLTGALAIRLPDDPARTYVIEISE
jgi:hypothetical protein